VARRRRRLFAGPFVKELAIVNYRQVEVNTSGEIFFKGLSVITIRPATESDWPAIWSMFSNVTRTGESFAYGPDTPVAVARKLWFDPPATPFIAEEGSLVLGTYYLRPNQPDRGSHVANGGYMVTEEARGKGLAVLMCQHSIETARAQGFRAIQYNYVVSTNTAAVHVWEKCGFRTLGKIPGGFRHDSHGYVDVLIMFREV
jgi:L-amino acid N-acyltransferase YncA